MKKLRSTFPNTKWRPLTAESLVAWPLHKSATLNDYVSYMEPFPDEIDLLFKDILISVTGFFRDPEVFNALKRALSQLLAEKNISPTKTAPCK